MAVDLSKFVMHSSFNSFKNNSVYTGSITIPATITSGSTYTRSVTFTMSEAAAFLQVHIFATPYTEYNYDGSYQNAWAQIESSPIGYALLDSPATSLYYFEASYTVVGNSVTVTIFIPNQVATFNTGSPVVPISFVEYNLAN